MTLTRRGFLGRLAIGVAALHLRFGVEVAALRPPREQLLVAHWFQTIYRQHYFSPEYLAELDRQLPPNWAPPSTTRP